MNIWLVVIIIVAISVTLSVIALVDLENKSHISHAKKKLLKKRVVFQDSSSKE